jgi:nucleoid DNA-binding protein
MKKSEVFKRTIIFLFAQLSKTQKKEIIDAISLGAKLTKADAGRLKKILERIFEGMPSKADAGRMLLPMSIAELTGIGLISGMSKAELIDAIKESAKLTKADAG